MKHGCFPAFWLRCGSPHYTTKAAKYVQIKRHKGRFRAPAGKLMRVSQRISMAAQMAPRPSQKRVLPFGEWMPAPWGRRWYE